MTSNLNCDPKLAEMLINELLEDPLSFRRKGKSTLLLEQFYQGFSLSRLRSLLVNKDRLVAKTAVSMMSELPDSDVDQFIDDAIALNNDDDRWIRHCALGIIMRVTIAYRHAAFAIILEHLEDADSLLIDDALFFFVMASCTQLRAALSYFSNAANQSRSIHLAGLSQATSSISLTMHDVEEMIDSKLVLMGLYGIGIAVRNSLIGISDIDFPETIRNPFLKSAASRLLNRYSRVRAPRMN